MQGTVEVIRDCRRTHTDRSFAAAASSEAGEGPAVGAEAAIDIVDLAFEPSTVEVSAGHDGPLDEHRRGAAHRDRRGRLVRWRDARLGRDVRADVLDATPSHTRARTIRTCRARSRQKTRRGATVKRR